MISLPSRKSGTEKLPLEVAIQKDCWAWLGELVVPYGGTSDGVKFLQDFSYMVPNGVQLGGGRQRRGQYMASLKAQGFRTGVSDIVIANPTFMEGCHGMGGGVDSSGHFGAYIELKRDVAAYKGPAALRAALRPEQRDWLELMAGVGYYAVVAYGLADFKLLVKNYLAGKTPRSLDTIPNVSDTS